MHVTVPNRKATYKNADTWLSYVEMSEDLRNAIISMVKNPNSTPWYLQNQPKAVYESVDTAENLSLDIEDVVVDGRSLSEKQVASNVLGRVTLKTSFGRIFSSTVFASTDGTQVFVAEPRDGDNDVYVLTDCALEHICKYIHTQCVDLSDEGLTSSSDEVEGDVEGFIPAPIGDVDETALFGK